MHSHPVTAATHPTPRLLKKVPFLAALALVVASAGCVVAPLPPEPIGQPSYGGPAYVAPAYVAPYYASPGVGWAWQYNRSYGWGWRHHRHGWHRGWR